MTRSSTPTLPSVAYSQQHLQDQTGIGATQLRNAFPAFRVYIYGYDVTQDVLDVNVSWNMGRSPNRCTVTLANELDKYIFTTEDFVSIYNDATITAIANALNQNPNNIGAGQAAVVNSVLQQQVLNNIAQPTKQSILGTKLSARISGVPGQDITGQPSNIPAFIGDALGYPLQAEDPIFHPNDPMRVFFRDPFNTKVWYHMFCGLLTDFDDSVDENNQNLLAITAEGPTKILRYARITTNPSAGINKPAIETNYDTDSQCFFETGFYGKTLPEVMNLLIFGSTPDDATTFTNEFRTMPELHYADGTHVRVNRLGAGGHFNYKNSAVIEFGSPAAGGVEDPLAVPSTSVTDLATYQALIDHQVKITDVFDMADEFAGGDELNDIQRDAATFQKLPDGTIDPTWIMDYIGTQPSLYPVTGGRLIMLLPASLSPATNREILTKELIKSPGLQSEFRSRLSIIYDIVERIEFMFYESPKGDLILEFPMYDFYPDNFGTSPVNGISITNNTQTPSSVQCGPFGPRYIITKHNTYNFSRQITDEKVRTQMAVGWAPLGNWDPSFISTEVQAPEAILLEHLIPLYGIRLEQADPKGFMTTPNAADLYAHILLNRINADSRNMGVNAVQNFGAWLNRPIYVEDRNCIGTCMSLTHSIKWGTGGSVDTRFNLSYLRGWDGLIDKGKPSYATIGGHAARPLDYSILFGLNNPPSSNNTTAPNGTANSQTNKQIKGG